MNKLRPTSMQHQYMCEIPKIFCYIYFQVILLVQDNCGLIQKQKSCYLMQKILYTLLLFLQVPCQLVLEIMLCHNSLSSRSFRMSIAFFPSHQAMLSKNFSLSSSGSFPFYLCCYKMLQTVPSHYMPNKSCLLYPDLTQKYCFSLNFHQYTLISMFGCPWNILQVSHP